MRRPGRCEDEIADADRITFLQRAQIEAANDDIITRDVVRDFECIQHFGVHGAHLAAIDSPTPPPQLPRVIAFDTHPGDNMRLGNRPMIVVYHRDHYPLDIAHAAVVNGAEPLDIFGSLHSGGLFDLGHYAAPFSFCARSASETSSCSPVASFLHCAMPLASSLSPKMTANRACDRSAARICAFMLLPL